MKRLGVNIDHVATLRNARGELNPDPVSAAKFAKKVGADSITIHLREDRRHIKDFDAKKICKALSNKIKKNFKKIDLILAPAMGGVVIGYEIGRLLKKETIFCERVNGKFILRRGFKIKKGSKVLIIEDVITTGKSSLECAKLIKKAKASSVGFATIIDRSTKKTLKIKKKIISHLKINVPTFRKNQLPKDLELIPIRTPGSRFIK